MSNGKMLWNISAMIEQRIATAKNSEDWLDFKSLEGFTHFGANILSEAHEFRVFEKGFAMLQKSRHFN